jgi:hypothetical protein
MIWLLLYLNWYGWGAEPKIIILAQFHSKEQCEEQAREMQAHLSGRVYCGEKP